MNKEYEYSFKVKDITPYIQYCINNNYSKEEETLQKRVLYYGENNVMARITTITKENETKTLLDFKNRTDLREILKVANETLPLEITKENEKAIMSILKLLNFKKKKTVIRKRYVFLKNKVMFEIDAYSNPKNQLVVAIEGNQKQVDKVYDEIRKIEKPKKVKL